MSFVTGMGMGIAGAWCGPLGLLIPMGFFGFFDIAFPLRYN
jgi:hypothetical protein